MEEWVTIHDESLNSMQLNVSDPQKGVKQEPNFEHGDSCTTNPSTSPSSSSSEYCSARTESMIEDRNKFSSELEFNIEFSKIHWSQLTDTDDDTEHSPEADLEHFERLKEDDHRWGGFFRDFESLVVGEKIAEGAQAEIYAGTLFDCYECVVKVFKQGYALRDLQRQWPQEIMKSFSKITLRKIRAFSIDSDYTDKNSKDYSKLECLHGGTVLKDERLKNRFAFVMKRQWGDLRTLIDAQMLKKKNRGPPFSTEIAQRLMLNIARDMRTLHQRNGIIHRDLKTSNVLVHFSHETLKSFERQGLDDSNDSSDITITDFECSIGVMGTGFWRAPEILQQLKDGIPTSKIRFSFQADIYSYGMTCYEIVTGCIPFEGYNFRDYDVVLNGDQRPKLPDDLTPWIRELISDCWHPNAIHRPFFSKIVDRIERFIDEKETKAEREKRIGIEKRIEKVRSSNNSGLIDGYGRPFIC